MPEITDYQIETFSSEDPMFPAKNLLSSSTNKKWKCGNLDNSSNFVILKLAKHTKIASINLGNQGSAFIEVLVADSREFGAEFKELILATTFMTQSDSMLQRNLNTVKCFPSNALVDEIKDKEWDRVKIVCKQPFNKTLKYGIAFINLQSPAPPKPRKSETDDEKSPIKNNQNNEEKKSSKSSEKVKKFGRFTMVMSSSDEEDEKTSTSFSRWKSSHFSDKKENSEKSLKRTIETKMSEDRNSKKFKKDDDKRKSSEKSKSSSSSSSRHRSKLMYESEDDEPNKKVEEKIKKDKSKEENSRFSHSSSSHSKSSTTTPKRVEEKTKLNFSSFIDDDEVDTKKENHRKSSSSRDHHKSSPKKPEKVETPKKPEKPEKLKKIEYKSFDKLFEGVTFAFSGYVNPERGILRNKAIEMGAKYQPDWNDRCTHLICAFSNTPKYQQVKNIPGKKIVTKKWIESCYSEKKRLPWRRFALDKHDKSDSESECEIHCKSHQEKVQEVVKELKSPENVLPKVKSFVDLSTDEEDCNRSTCENQVFKGKVFYLNTDLSATDSIKLKDQIISMAGKVTSSAKNADYIIANSSSNLPTGDDIKGECLKGLWINEVYELEAIIPIQRYRLKD